MLETVGVILLFASIGIATLISKTFGWFGFVPFYSRSRTKHLITLVKTHQALENTIIEELENVGFITRWRVKRYMKGRGIYLE